MVPTGAQHLRLHDDGGPGQLDHRDQDRDGQRQRRLRHPDDQLRRQRSRRVPDHAGHRVASAVTQSGGTLSSAVVFTVTVSDASVCGLPTLTFPGPGRLPRPADDKPSGGNSFTFTLPTTGRARGRRDPHDHATASNGGGDTENDRLVVSNAPDVHPDEPHRPNPADVKSKGQHGPDVTIRVTRSSVTVCAVPTVTVTPGPAASCAGRPDDRQDHAQHRHDRQLHEPHVRVVIARQHRVWDATPSSPDRDA